METKEELQKGTHEAFKWMFQHSYRDSNKLKESINMPSVTSYEVSKAIDKAILQERQRAERFKEAL